MSSAAPLCTVFDLSSHSQLRFTGADRAKFLHGFCTNEIRALPTGGGCEAFACNVKGRVLGHFTVFVEPDALWLETVSGAATALARHFDRYIIREDVAVEDLTGQFAEFYLTGVHADRVLTQCLTAAGLPADLIVEELARLSRPGVWTVSESTWGTLSVCGVDWLGGDDFLLRLPIAESHSVAAGWEACGATIGTAEVWDASRIAAGWPEYGRDITEDNLPQEVARNTRCISFRKGCYLGQEPVARLDALGHTNRELRRLSWESDFVPAAGAEIFDASSHEVTGKITSAARNPRNTGGNALAYVKTRWANPGTAVHLETASGPVVAIVS